MKSLNTIIPFEVYPFDLMISFCEIDSRVLETLKKYDIIPSEDDPLVNMDIEKLLKGRTSMFFGGQIMLRLNFMPTQRHPEEMAILQHEIFHVVEFLMLRINMPLVKESDEAYAYMIQFLTEKIYSLLK